MSALGAPRAKLIVLSAIDASSIRTVRYSAASGDEGRRMPEDGDLGLGMPSQPGEGRPISPDAGAILLPDAGVPRAGQDRTAGLWQRRLRDRPRAGRSPHPLGRAGLTARRRPGLETRGRAAREAPLPRQ